MTDIPSTNRMTPTAYNCDGCVEIHLYSIGPRYPEWWYLSQPIFTMNAEDMGWSRERALDAKEQGLGTAYWNGEAWNEHTPKQFQSPEEAWEEYWTKAKRKEE